jgi:hypothetical protein
LLDRVAALGGIAKGFALDDGCSAPRNPIVKAGGLGDATPRLFLCHCERSEAISHRAVEIASSLRSSQ